MDRTDAFARLAALQESVRLAMTPARSIYDPKGVADLFRRYLRVRDALRADLPALFDDLPVWGSDTSASYSFDDMIRLFRDIQYCLTVLSTAASPPAAVPMSVTREGVFLAGQHFDALQRIREIVDTARSSIVIVDGYVDAKVLDLLTAKSPSVTARLLTKGVSPALSAAASAFNKQYGGLSIRTSNAFHDRFVIVDDQDFYHFGASLKDAGNRGFMFSRIEESHVVGAVRVALAKEWQAATIVV